MPKSGEQELQIAPMEALASMAITAMGMLGTKPAILSPGSTPAKRMAAVSSATRWYNC